MDIIGEWEAVEIGGQEEGEECKQKANKNNNKIINQVP